MKKLFQTISLLLIVAVSGMFLQSCKKPCKGVRTITYAKPILKDKAEVRANIKSQAPKPVKNPGKIYKYGNYIFLNEINRGIHVIDNSNPASPINMSFIEMPGNVDIAIKGSLLYADFYTDMVVMDISNPLAVTVRNYVNKVFDNMGAQYAWGNDSNRVVVDWEQVTERVEYNCDEDGTVFNDILPVGVIMLGTGNSNSHVATPNGMGGSMARFALVNNFLYTVSNRSLNTYSLSTPLLPQKTNTLALPWGVETIFPFGGKLFIGSTTGMHICDLQNPAIPIHTSTFAHARACDPVITDGTHAYVTLRTGNVCSGIVNQMDVLDVTNIYAPELLKTYTLTNPMGLGKDGNLLFVCDGSSGVRVYNAANPLALLPLTTITIPDATDVIMYNGIALIVSPTGLHQYDYSNPSQIKLLSTIAISK